MPKGNSVKFHCILNNSFMNQFLLYGLNEGYLSCLNFSLSKRAIIVDDFHMCSKRHILTLKRGRIQGRGDFRPKETMPFQRVEIALNFQFLIW